MIEAIRMIPPHTDQNLIEDIDCYDDIDSIDDGDDGFIPSSKSSLPDREKVFMEKLLSLADNFEEYFYCILSFLQDGLKIDPVLFPMLTFPQKLYILLNYDDSVRGIIEWCFDGTAFQILNRDRFLREVVPRYFKQNCFRSFDRLTHLYRFERFRVRTSRAVLSTATRYLSSSYCYRHPLFLRNRVEWISTICRPKPNSPESHHPHKRSTNFLPPRFIIPRKIYNELEDSNVVLSPNDVADDDMEGMELERKVTDHHFLSCFQMVKNISN